MSYQTAAAKAGSTLYLAAAATVAGAVFATTFLVSFVFAGLDLGLLRGLGSASVIGLLVAAPLAIGASLMVRCHGCDRLVLPLVYDGKSLFSRKAPSAVSIGKTALSVVFQRHAACPHCGVDTQV